VNDPDTIDALTKYFPWIIPECVLAAAACVLFLGATFRRDRNLWGAFSLLALSAAGVALWLTPLPAFESRDGATSFLYASPIWLDKLGFFVKAVAILGGAVLTLMTWQEVDDDHAAEFHGCLLVITAGVCFTSAANDLVTLFLALELISIPTYVALYLPKEGEKAQEAAVKYFLLSVFSSALLLFGFSYLYGIAGTTNLRGITSAMTQLAQSDETMPGIAVVALVMIVAGLGFKITAVPFHFYAPDVYEGTSTGMAALLAFVPKVAGFVALIRVFGLLSFELPAVAADLPLHGGGPIVSRDLSTLLWIIAAVTMTLGNVLALLQDNVKRMLAYSSVAHSGYMLVGLAVAPSLLGQDAAKGMSSRGTDTILFYLVSYGAMTVGAFAVMTYLSTRQKSVETVDDLAGLSKSHPGVALVMALFLFSLVGLPPTPGFYAKWELLMNAFSVKAVGEAGWREPAVLFRILALIMVVNAAIGSWYYMRIITVMYLRTPLQPLAKQKPSPSLVAVAACAVVTLALFYPTPLVNRASEAIDGKVKITEKTADSGNPQPRADAGKLAP
jgi:NADH-quinone oxidoreductase subunit N